MLRTFLILFGLLLMVACSEGPAYPKNDQVEWIDIQADLQKLLIQAQDSDTITLPAGHFLFSGPLLVDGKTDLTLKGAGEKLTVLSFAVQEEGAEGLKISNCENLILRDFTIEDAKGDNIKATDCKNIRFQNITSQWNGKPKQENGAYAFYPVLCQGVLMENCKAIGASDAGIYVGQSDSVIIRNNEVYYNVAGIESENSRWVEIYDNYAHHNTGGILVFDLPGLTQSGHSTKVFRNKIHQNNHPNFAPAGNVVATVPPGTGLMLLATRKVDIFQNEISHNRTVGLAIASYKLVEAMSAEDGTNLAANVDLARRDTAYKPYPNQISLAENQFKNDYTFPSLKSDFGWLFLWKMPFNTPDIVWDGIRSPEEEFELCVSEEKDPVFLDLDAAHDFEGLSTDLAPFKCQASSWELKLELL